MQNKLYEEIKSTLEKYDDNRQAASDFLDVGGMEEAIIDELESRGYEVRDDQT